MSSRPSRHLFCAPRFLPGIALVLVAHGALAQDEHGNNDVAPAMAAFSSQSHHYHGTGNFMFKYRFMHMAMKGLRDGSKSVSTNEGLGNPYNYPMVPTSMDMNMHMLEGMYGMSDSFAFMAMGQYISGNMKMAATSTPGLPVDRSTMTAKGFGDTTLTLLFRANHNLMTNIGFSLPTGAINLAGNMTMGGVTVRNRLPYDMQLGSGTYDLKPSVTYSLRNGPWGFGAQGEYTFRTGLNEYGYKFGNRRDVQAWMSWAMNNNTEFLARAEIATWGHVKGSDPNITLVGAGTGTGTGTGAGHNMPGMVDHMGGTTTATTNAHMSPNNDPANTGGMQFTTFVGMSGKSNTGNFGFAIEAGLPLYQKLNGVQLRTNSVLSSSISFSF